MYNPPMLSRLSGMLQWLLFGAVFAALLTTSTPPLTDQVGQVRRYTRQIEFDYVRWMLGALTIKFQQGAAGLPGYMDRASRKQVVMDYLHVTQEIIDGEGSLQRIYADASIPDKQAASADLRAQLSGNYQRQEELAPLAEAV